MDDKYLNQDFLHAFPFFDNEIYFLGKLVSHRRYHIKATIYVEILS